MPHSSVQRPVPTRARRAGIAPQAASRSQAAGPPRIRRVPAAVLVSAALAIAVAAAACGGNSSRTPDTAGAAPTPPASVNAPGTAGAPASAPAGGTASAVPAPVEAVGRYGEDAYDMVKANDWAKTRAVVDSLKQAVTALPASSGAGANAADVHTAVAALDRAVTARDRAVALREANHLTSLGAHLATAYHPQVPTDVAMLDYYGRELEIWSAAKDQAKLRATAAAMRRTWDGLRPQVEAHGGTAEAQRFDALVKQVDAASTPAAYAAVATPVLNEVDALEKVFTR